MILIAVLLVIVIAVFIKNNNRLANPGFVKIRYGKKENRFHRLCLIISGIYLVFGFGYIFFSDMLAIHNSSVEGLVVSTWSINIILFFVLVLFYIDSSLYLRELNKSGYIVPESMKDFGGYLNNVPKKSKAELSEPSELSEFSLEGSQSEQQMVTRERSYVILAAIALVEMLGCSVFAISYYFKWRFTSDGSAAVLIIIAALCWGITAFVIFNLSDNTKYRSSTVLYDTRSSRFSFSGCLIFVVVMTFFTIIFMNLMMSMTNYIYKSKLSADKELLNSVSGRCQVLYEEYVHTGTYDIDMENSIKQLENGVDIMSGDANENLLLYNAINFLGYKEADLLADKIHLDDTHYIITIADGTVSGEYINEHVDNN